MTCARSGDTGESGDSDESGESVESGDSGDSGDSCADWFSNKLVQNKCLLLD